jgi:hypothetical protein
MSGTLDYRLAAPQATIAPNAVVIDSNANSTADGTLKVEVVPADTHDKLGVSGLATVDADNNVRVNNVVIGTLVSNGIGDRPLQIDFNSSASPSAVQQLIRAITFQNIGGSASERTAVFTLLNGSGPSNGPGRKHIRVTAGGSVPDIQLSGTIEYRRNAPPTAVAPEAIVTESGTYPSGGPFTSGTLTVETTPAGEKNRLWIDGPFVVEGSAVKLADQQVGTVVGNGIGEQRLEIALSATLQEVQQLVRAITYQNVDGNLGSRQVKFVLTDSNGAPSQPAFKTVEVTQSADDPTLTLSGTVGYQRGSVPLILAPNATVTSTAANADPQFHATLQVAVTPAGSNNRLWIGGPSYVSGNRVYARSGNSYVAIGTVTSNGIGNQPLTIVLDFSVTSTTAPLVQQLVRSINYQNVSGDLGTRTVQFTLTDENSVTTTTAPKTVNVVTSLPELSLSGSLGYQRNAPAVTLAPNATVTDVDSGNFSGGQLRVRITSGGGTANTLAIGSGFTVDATGNVKQGTLVIGKRLSNGIGTNELKIQFNSNATKSIVQSLVRSITYRNVGGSAGQRTIAFTVSDGDGGLSAVRTKTVNVT